MLLHIQSSERGDRTVFFMFSTYFFAFFSVPSRGSCAQFFRIRSSLGAEIYGVSVDSAEKHLDFAKQYGLSFALLSDKDGKVSTAYGSVLKIPFFGTFSNRCGLKRVDGSWSCLQWYAERHACTKGTVPLACQLISRSPPLLQANLLDRSRGQPSLGLHGCREPLVQARR
jgi:hypothetical protein